MKSIQAMSLKAKYLILIFTVLTVLMVLISGSILYGIKKMEITTKIQVKEKFTKMAKRKLNNQIDIVYNSIKALQESVTPQKIMYTARKTLLSKVNFLSNAIINTFYGESSSMLSVNEIEQDMINLISNLKWGDGNYFFALNMNGITVAHPNPNVIGKKVPIPAIIKALNDFKSHPRKNFEFVEYKWKNPKTDKMDLKVTVLKRFPLMNWVIGTGMYMSDLVQQKKQEALNIIKKTRYGKHGYFFLVNENGITILDPLHPNFNGKPATPVMPAIKQIQKGKHQAYVEYNFTNPNTGKKDTKFSLLRDFKPWHWVIGTGMYMSEINGNLNSITNTFNRSARKLLLWVTISAIIAFAIAVFIGSRFSHIFITSKLKGMMETLESIKNGDFRESIRVRKDSKDEIDMFAAALNSVINDIKEVINTIRIIADKLQTKSEQLTKSSVSMADVGEHTGKNMEDVAHAVSDLTQATNSVAQAMEDINNFITKTGENQKQILANFERKVKQSKENLKITESAKEKIDGVEQSAKEIGQIVNVITEIADQTNLLALNAAIEAARAGEHGRGFAVVADEVRKLAERTMRATEEIRTMINTIQKQTKEAVNETNAVGNIIIEDAKDIEKSKKNIEKIVGELDDVINQVSQISASIEELSATAQEINNQVNEVSQLAIENSKTIKEVAAMAEDLHRISKEIKAKSIVERFKL